MTESIKLESSLRKVKVLHKETPPDWFMVGGIEHPEEEFPIEDDSNTFYYQKWYDPDLARFEDIPTSDKPRDQQHHKFCLTCDRLDQLRKVDKELYPKGDYIKGSIESIPEPFRVGRMLVIFCKKSLG
nr:DNA (cytosine-5)-methyltransferase PliMCI-like [Crassostrea gigas]